MFFVRNRQPRLYLQCTIYNVVPCKEEIDEWVSIDKTGGEQEDMLIAKRMQELTFLQQKQQLMTDHQRSHSTTIHSVTTFA